MAVAIVTDSTSDISQVEAERLGLTVVPLNIHFGTESLRDGVDIMPAEFFERLKRSKELPKTSQPSAGTFLDVYRRLAQETDQILSIHLSAKLSGTSNSARAAREALGGKAKVEILDSGTVSWPLGFAARTAREAAEAGGELAGCLRAAEDALARTRLYFVLDTLEYLQKGGRIGGARAFLGQVFNIKPILTVREGEVAPLERVRSRMKAEERLFELATSGGGEIVRLAVAHSSSDAEAERWIGRMQEAEPGVPCELIWLGPVVGVYAGPNTLGMAAVAGAAPTTDADGEHTTA
jgi:DegV family protein with EDD domain